MRKRKAIVIAFLTLNIALIYLFIESYKSRSLEAEEKVLLFELGCVRFVLNIITLTPWIDMCHGGCITCSITVINVFLKLRSMIL